MDESTNLLGWLENWYQAQCVGEWAQDRGVTIETLDNPGWLFKADLVGTTYRGSAEDRVLDTVGEPPSEKNGNIGGERWMLCELKGGKFVGAGDPTKLHAIVVRFKRLVEDDRNGSKP